MVSLLSKLTSRYNSYTREGGVAGEYSSPRPPTQFPNRVFHPPDFSASTDPGSRRTDDLRINGLMDQWARGAGGHSPPPHTLNSQNRVFHSPDFPASTDPGSRQTDNQRINGAIGQGSRRTQFPTRLIPNSSFSDLRIGEEQRFLCPEMGKLRK